MGSLLGDIKCMLMAFDDVKYLLVASCEIANFVPTNPIKIRLVVADVLIHKVICIFGTPKLLIVEKDFVFTAKNDTIHIESNQLSIKNNKPILSWQSEKREADTNH